LPELHATAAELKAFCTNLAGDGLEEVKRCCGGHGVLMSGGIAKFTGEYNTIAPVAEGDKIVLALQGARYLVRAVQGLRKGQSPPAAAKYLEEKELPDLSRPRDLSVLVHAFGWRARDAAFRVTDRLEATLKKGLDFDEAWNSCAVQLVKAAENHAFYLLLKAFIDGLKYVKDAPTEQVLATLANNFALVQVRENAADWIPHVSSEQLVNINQAIAEILKEIRPNAVALVDAFGFSDNSLQSALGRYDGNVYEALYDYAKKSPLNEPAYIEEFHREHLSKVLDKEYLAQSKRRQRADPVAKL